MILLSIGLILLAIFGAPLFTVIAASAMLGYHHEGIDLMGTGGMVSAVHTEADAEHTAEAFARTIRLMKEEGVL